MNAVQQEDCSTHEVHGQRNCDHRSLSKCAKRNTANEGKAGLRENTIRHSLGLIYDHVYELVYSTLYTNIL